jgi:hypothetical protein
VIDVNPRENDGLRMFAGKHSTSVCGGHAGKSFNRAPEEFARKGVIFTIEPDSANSGGER